MNAIREDLKAKEIIKEAEAKRKGSSKSLHTSQVYINRTCLLEKLEDAKARAAIKAQIEADKKARAEKAAREKALREGREYTETAPAAPAAAAPSASALSGTAGRDYPQTRLQIRLASGGQPYTTTLPSDASMFCSVLQTIILHSQGLSIYHHF